MNIIDSVQELQGKKVLVRVDFDVPVGADNMIQEEYRIERQRATIQYLLDRGARVLMIAHISAVQSFEPILNQIQKILQVPVEFCRSAEDIERFWAEGGSIALLENLRSNPGEEDNSESFARSLAVGCDLFVYNAFAVCHREHASVATVPLMVPSYGGLLMREETEQLQRVVDAPASGKVVYMGGAKASTKVPVVKHMLTRAERVVIGGVLANDIMQELGQDIGNSQVDEDAHELLEGLDIHDARIMLPIDAVVAEGQNLDIGIETSKIFADAARGASLIVWNGPMGRFEDSRFMAGTKAVARAIAESGAMTVIGGGDTISAVHSLGLLQKFSFISTGGGAMLAFLAGMQLPGLKALGYYHD